MSYPIVIPSNGAWLTAREQMADRYAHALAEPARVGHLGVCASAQYAFAVDAVDAHFKRTLET